MTTLANKPQPVQRLALRFAERIILAERIALAAGFYNCGGFRDECARAGLGTDHFVPTHHRRLAQYIFDRAEAGEFATYAGGLAAIACGPDPVQTWADESTLCAIIDLHYIGSMLPVYVETVRGNARDRAEASAMFSAAARIIDGQVEGQYQVLIQPKARKRWNTTLAPA